VDVVVDATAGPAGFDGGADDLDVLFFSEGNEPEAGRQPPDWAKPKW
jgi:hypothetical protein